MNRPNRHRTTRTERESNDQTDDATDRRTDDRTMRGVSHTHPYADRGALDRLFERGPVVAADGGEREAYDEEGTEASEEEKADAREEDDAERGTRDQMRDVNHTPPHGGDGVDRVFERGGAEEPVESEE